MDIEAIEDLLDDHYWNLMDVNKLFVERYSLEELQEIKKVLEVKLQDPENKSINPLIIFTKEEVEFQITILVVEPIAKEYMDRTGTTYYCSHCRGTCTPEHIKEFE